MGGWGPAENIKYNTNEEKKEEEEDEEEEEEKVDISIIIKNIR